MRRLVLIADFLFALVVVAATVGCGGLFFKRNPNLTLLQTSVSGNAHNPVWSPDGLIYYTIEGNVGQIRAIRPDGSGDRPVISGAFGNLSVSPNGSRLAATTGFASTGRLLLIDTSGVVLDTLTLPDVPVVSARFGDTEDRLYYFVFNRGIYRIDLASHHLDTILVQGSISTPILDFDVWDDSLLAVTGRIYDLKRAISDTMPALLWSRFRPSDPSRVLGVPRTGSYDLVEVNLSTGAVTPMNALPFWSSEITSASWSRDGKVIVLSAAPFVNDWETKRPGTFQLWLLKAEN